MTRLHAVLLLLATLVLSLPSMAQTTEVVSPEALQSIVSKAQADGAEVVIVRTAPQDTQPETTPTISLDEQALRFRNRFAAILADAENFPGHAMETIGGDGPDGSYTWPITAALLAIVFLALGAVASYLLSRWSRAHFMYLFNPTPASRAEKVSYLLVRGVMMFVGLALQVGIAAVLVFVFDGNHQPVRATQLVVIGIYAFVRGLLIFFFNLLAPDTPSHRMLHLSDDEANSFYRGLGVTLAISSGFMGLCVWMDLLELQVSAHKLSLITGLLITTLLFAAFSVWQRNAIANIVIGADADRVGLARKLFAKNLHVLIGLYFILAWCFATYRLVMDEPDAIGLIGGPVLLTFAGIAGYGVALLFIEWAMTRRRPPEPEVETTAPSWTSDEPTPTTETDGEPVHAMQGNAGATSVPPQPAAAVEPVAEVGDEASIANRAEPDEPPMILQPSAMKMLFERTAGIVIAVLTLSGILNLWGLDLTETGFLKGLWEIILVGFLAYLAYSSVNIVVEQKMAEEGGDDDHVPEPGEEGGRGGSTRLGTLLPMFRNFLLIVIVVIAAMIVLSEIGVNIAPLFAGAGVVGLAVGFGAQTLIADIFSGAFFLIDDAFRKGEYIEIDGTRGTVERISIRSMQLRHQNGPVHTIPFSQIKTLTNYSRDWAVMKLPLRLTYDTDPEKVRKLIKKLGIELMENPVFGHQFLAPLKSQGVLQMEDSAMIMRVKFMTRPGEQFTLRKEVYRHIRDLFEKEGIKFAHREVTVRVAEADHAPPLAPDQKPPLTQEQKEAVAGAVAPLMDVGQQGDQKKGDDR